MSKFLRKKEKQKPTHFRESVFQVAEKEGFEPSIPLWGIHDFQSCALDRATRLLHIWCRSSERMLLYDEDIKMSTPFLKFLKNFLEGKSLRGWAEYGTTNTTEIRRYGGAFYG